MKQIVALFLFITLFTQAQSQTNIKVIYFDKSGAVDDNPKTAYFFSLVKKYPGYYQKLYYGMHAPLQKSWTYSDSELNILEGPYYEYSPEGNLSIVGQYTDNLKDGSWSHYNDTGKVVLWAKYKKGILLSMVNPDTVKKQSNNDSVFKSVEREAFFKKNKDKGWAKYLSKNLDADVAFQSINGGTVRAAFRVDTTGKCVDIYLRRSVEWVLDQELIRVITNSPLWEPAIQNGKLVSAYRIQPITFVKGR